jgi:hypothetical protein
MTNSVRVEWLNSFTYFANRGLYAVNGAELRSIGSANVYGNIGAEADGDDTIMYLIGHNFAYISSGKDVSNDRILVDQTKETIELNNGRIYFSSTDHTGTFRVGNNFFVDFDRGTTSVDISTLTTNSLSGLVVTTDNSTTTIAATGIETGNIRIDENLIQSLIGDLNLQAASVTVNLLDSTAISGNLDIVGNFSYSGSLNIKGDEATDAVTFNVLFDQDFNPNQTLKFSLGTPSKRWLVAHLNRMEVGDFSVYDNVIETNVTNADLELRASGTGSIYIPDSATFSNALSVAGTTTLDDTAIQGDFTLTGNLNQTGNAVISNDLDITQNLTLGLAAQFEEILIDANTVTTTSSNTDLELRASGTGIVNVQTSLILGQDISADNIQAQSNVSIAQTVDADNAQIADIEINDNYIQTVSLNQSLTLLANGNVSVLDNDVNVVQNLTVQGDSDIQSLAVSGLVSHTGDRTQIGNYTIAGEFTNGNILIEDNFIATSTINSDLELLVSNNGIVLIPTNDVEITNNLTVSSSTTLKSLDITGSLIHTGDRTQIGNYTIAGEFTNGNVLIEDNFITTTTSNSDLELRASGTGIVLVPSNDVAITNNLTVDGATNLQSIEISGQLYHSGNRTQTGNYNQTGNLEVTGSIDIDSAAQFTDILISGNTVTTTENNSNLVLISEGFGTVDIDSSLIINNNLTVNAITVQGDIEIDQDLELAKISIPPSIIGIKNNYITTKDSNSNLELRASGSGSVLVESNNIIIENDLTVLGNTDLQDVDVTGTLTHTGNRIQPGVYNQTGDLTIDGGVFAPNTVKLSDIEIDQNTLSSVNGNLLLEASAAGDVIFSALTVEQQLSAGTLNAGNITIDDTVSLSVLESSTDIQIFNNVITTTNSNSNLELRASGTGSIWLQQLAFNTNTVSTVSTNITLSPLENVEIFSTGAVVLPKGSILQRTNTTGDIRFNTDDAVFEAHGLASTITFNGVYSSDRRTSVLAHPTNDTLLFTVNQTQVGLVSNDAFSLHKLQVNNLSLDNNIIASTVPDSDIELQFNGAGELVIDNVSVKDNFIKNNGASLILVNTGNGYSKIAANNGVVFPTGTVAQRPIIDPELGDTRFNTEDEVLEVWDGSTYIAAAGTSSSITASEFNDIVLEYSLILG